MLCDISELKEKINQCTTYKRSYSYILHPGKFWFEKENETNATKRKPDKLNY
jgi:hypothetical protein